MVEEMAVGALWVRVDANLLHHPKLRRAARVAGTTPGRMLGVVVALWGWAQQFAADGDITRFDPIEIAEAVAWEGDPDTLWRALTLNGAGFVDVQDAAVSIGTRRPDPQEQGGEAGRVKGEADPAVSPLTRRVLLHDWEEYGGKLHRQREAAAARVRRHRAKTDGEPGDDPPGNADVTVTSPLRNALEKRREEERRGEIPASQEEKGAAPDGRQVAAASSGEKRTHRIPPDWHPDEGKVSELATRYADVGGEPWVRDQTTRMVEWFQASGGRKVDWNLTWQTWLRNAADRERDRASRGARSGPRPSPAPRPIGSRDEFDRTDADYAARWGKGRPADPA